MTKHLILGTSLAFCCMSYATASIPLNPEIDMCNETTFGMTNITSGRVALEPLWIPEEIQPCPEGMYLPRDEIECAVCTANHYCQGTPTTTISNLEDRGIAECESGLHSAVGAKTAAECCPEGTDWNSVQQACAAPTYVCESTKWLHIGEGESDKICLKTTKPENVPSLVISLGADSVFYLPLSSDTTLPIHTGSSKKLHIEYNGQTYNAHDDSVEQ